MLVVVIDNFDSFTYNIAGAFESLGEKTLVITSNALTIETLSLLNPDYIVIGPGPDTPSAAGISKQAISFFSGKKPILGICLGHQAIGETFGAQTVESSVPMHGKLSAIFHSNEGLFKGMKQGFLAARYHSLVIDPTTLSLDIKVSATTDTGEIMGICHKEDPTFGVQFHPEAFLTHDGEKIFKNFLSQ